MHTASVNSGSQFARRRPQTAKAFPSAAKLVRQTPFARICFLFSWTHVATQNERRKCFEPHCNYFE